MTKSTEWRVKLHNLLQTSARIMRSSLYGQRIPAQFCNTESKCLVSTKKKESVGKRKPITTLNMSVCVVWEGPTLLSPSDIIRSGRKEIHVTLRAHRHDYIPGCFTYWFQPSGTLLIRVVMI